jgi:type II secretory pathway component GspD/PulD (secretin)
MKYLAARLLLLPILLMLTVLAHAEMSYLTLKHRNAETLIPLLQPVLDDGISISGFGPTLIVNSKPWQIEEVRTLVEQLDTPLLSLMIHVIQGGSDTLSALHSDVSGTVKNAKIRVYGTKNKEKDAVSQQLRVNEGEWAMISSGESVPVARQSTSHSPQGISVQQSIEYKDVESGFEVRPRISGERVTIEVRPFRARRSKEGGGIIEQQNIITTVSGNVGEWITIGGIDEQQQHSAAGTVYTTGKKRSTTHNIKLRVERLPN